MKKFYKVLLIAVILPLKSDTDSSYSYDSYNRIAARDYANRYTSECQSGGENTNYWNTYEYPFSIHLSSDCADYVSQALYAGGIPMDSIHDVNHFCRTTC